MAHIERFLAKVDLDGECWRYNGHHNKDGYPMFSVAGESIGAARWVAQYMLGRPLATAEFVCHTCDRPSCCNPAHLWLGSADANNKDRARKGRSNRLPTTAGRINAPRDAHGRFAHD